MYNPSRSLGDLLRIGAVDDVPSKWRKPAASALWKNTCSARPRSRWFRPAGAGHRCAACEHSTCTGANFLSARRRRDRAEANARGCRRSVVRATHLFRRNSRSPCRKRSGCLCAALAVGAAVKGPVPMWTISGSTRIRPGFSDLARASFVQPSLLGLPLITILSSKTAPAGDMPEYTIPGAAGSTRRQAVVDAALTRRTPALSHRGSGGQKGFYDDRDERTTESRKKFVYPEDSAQGLDEQLPDEQVPRRRSFPRWHPAVQALPEERKDHQGAEGRAEAPPSMETMVKIRCFSSSAMGHADQRYHQQRRSWTCHDLIVRGLFFHHPW